MSENTTAPEATVDTETVIETETNETRVVTLRLPSKKTIMKYTGAALIGAAATAIVCKLRDSDEDDDTETAEIYVLDPSDVTTLENTSVND